LLFELPPAEECAELPGEPPLAPEFPEFPEFPAFPPFPAFPEFPGESPLAECPGGVPFDAADELPLRGFAGLPWATDAFP
jgi:hypothetical protein